METVTTNERISFWDGNHPMQEQMETFLKQLVPDFGDAETPEGQVMRFCGNLFHEYANNGNCNAVDEGDTEEDEFEPTTINEHYSDMLSYIKLTVLDTEEDVAAVREVMLKYKPTFEQEEMDAYNRLCEKCLHWVASRV